MILKDWMSIDFTYKKKLAKTLSTRCELVVRASDADWEDVGPLGFECHLYLATLATLEVLRLKVGSSCELSCPEVTAKLIHQLEPTPSTMVEAVQDKQSHGNTTWKSKIKTCLITPLFAHNSMTLFYYLFHTTVEKIYHLL